MTELFDHLVATAPTHRPRVENLFPTLDAGVPYRIAIIGEAPGADEVVVGKPFVGVSGRWLDYLMSRAGILRSACFLGNVCQVRPPNNDIDRFDWEGEEIQNGLTQLQIDLTRFQPHICVCLGATALRAAKGYVESISKWRGSLFIGGSGTPFESFKCIATFHPASSLRVYEQAPYTLFDLKKARREGDKKQLDLPQRTFKVLCSLGDVQLELHRLTEAKRKTATDIEGYVKNLTCISLANDPLYGIVIPFTGPNGNYWSAEDEFVVWQELKNFLEDPSIPKTLQNGLYDRFVLAYTYGILVRGVSDDTMIKWWEVFCELEKKLYVQASICTNEPYYKDERGSDNWQEFWCYSGKDGCVTIEIDNFLETSRELRGPPRDHYRFNIAMQDPILYMELRGMRYDQEKAQQTAKKIQGEINLLQHEINKVAGRALAVQTAGELLDLLRKNICLKRATIQTFGDVESNCYKKFEPVVKRIVELCCRWSPPFSPDVEGELTRLLEIHLNTDSPPQMKWFLYEKLGLPKQYDRKTKELTTNALSILSLFKQAEKQEKFELAQTLKTLLRIANKLTQLQTLQILRDPDGRIRCSYNVVGTETGRLSCSKSPTRSGYNLQTVTKKQRNLFLPDDGYFMFQCDLSGADGWTVAAHCKRLGDPTMLEDYLQGLKPAKIIARMYEGLNTSNLSREVLKEECKKVDADGWLYMACKRVQHGSNYGMKKVTMSNQILEDSWKYNEDPIYVPPSVCEDLQILYFQRYSGIQTWQRWVNEQLKNTRQLQSANGHIRRFFGRPNEHGTQKAAYSDEPQNNTTYATNVAVLRLWNDPENRRSEGSLIIEPLHQIHDAVLGQFPRELVEWACPKIRTYFDNQFVIGGERIRIPFEGRYGSSWLPADLTNPI